MSRKRLYHVCAALVLLLDFAETVVAQASKTTVGSFTVSIYSDKVRNESIALASTSSLAPDHHAWTPTAFFGFRCDEQRRLTSQFAVRHYLNGTEDNQIEVLVQFDDQTPLPVWSPITADHRAALLDASWIREHARGAKRMLLRARDAKDGRWFQAAFNVKDLERAVAMTPCGSS